MPSMKHLVQAMFIRFIKSQRQINQVARLREGYIAVMGPTTNRNQIRSSSWEKSGAIISSGPGRHICIQSFGLGFCEWPLWMCASLR